MDSSLSLWVHGLYVRPPPLLRSNTFDQLVAVYGSNARLWLTDVTLQGNGDGVRDCDDCALEVSGSALAYASGGISTCMLCDVHRRVHSNNSR